MPPKRARHSAVPSSSSSATIKSERKTRSKSLGGTDRIAALKPKEEPILSPGKLRRRSLVPKKSILKTSVSATSVPTLNNPASINDDDDQTVAVGTLGFQGINTEFTQNLRLAAENAPSGNVEEDDDEGPRPALARRVSFASKAHIRLFERVTNSPSVATSASSDEHTTSFDGSNVSSNMSLESSEGHSSMDMTNISSSSSFISDRGPAMEIDSEGDSMEFSNVASFQSTGDDAGETMNTESTSGSAEERELEALRNLRERRRSLRAFVEDDDGERDMEMTNVHLEKEHAGDEEESMSMDTDAEGLSIQDQLVDRSERRRSGSILESLRSADDGSLMDFTNVYAGNKSLAEQSMSFASEEDESMEMDDGDQTINITETIARRSLPPMSLPECPQEEFTLPKEPISTVPTSTVLQDEVVDKENDIVTQSASTKRRPFGSFKPIRPSPLSRPSPAPSMLVFPQPSIFQALEEDNKELLSVEFQEKKRRHSSPRRAIREVEEEEVQFSPQRILSPIHITGINRRMSTIPEVTEVMSESSMIMEDRAEESRTGNDASAVEVEESRVIGGESSKVNVTFGFSDETMDMSRSEKVDAYRKLTETIRRLSVGTPLAGPTNTLPSPAKTTVNADSIFSSNRPKARASLAAGAFKDSTKQKGNEIPSSARGRASIATAGPHKLKSPVKSISTLSMLPRPPSSLAKPSPARSTLDRERSRSRSRSASPVKRVASPVKYKSKSPVRNEVPAVQPTMQVEEDISYVDFLRDNVGLDPAPVAVSEAEFRQKLSVLTPLKQKATKSMADVVVAAVCKGSLLKLLEAQKMRSTEEVSKIDQYFADLDKYAQVPAIMHAWKVANSTERVQLKAQLATLANCARAKVKAEWYDGKIADHQIFHTDLEMNLAGIQKDHEYVKQVLLHLGNLSHLEMELQTVQHESGIRSKMDYDTLQFEQQKQAESIEEEYNHLSQDLKDCEKRLTEVKLKRQIENDGKNRNSLATAPLLTFKQKFEFDAAQIVSGWRIHSSSKEYVEMVHSKEVICGFNIDKDERVRSLRLELVPNRVHDDTEDRLKHVLFNRFKHLTERDGVGMNMKEIVALVKQRWSNCVSITTTLSLALRKHIVDLYPSNDSNSFLQARLTFVSRRYTTVYYVYLDISDEDLCGEDPVGGLSIRAGFGPGKNQVNLDEVVYIIRDSISQEVLGPRNADVLAKACNLVETKYA